MIRIYLCDDKPAIFDSLGTSLSETATKHSLDIRISTFTSGDQLLFYYEDTSDEPDIIFLDIMMEGSDGLSTARQLRTLGCQAELIFLTSNPEFVFDSFDVLPANYILKQQVSQKRLEEVFLKAVSMAGKKTKALFLCENGAMRHNIPLTSIYYFEVSNRLVTVHYDTTSFEFYSSLEDVAEKLDSPAFLRVHRSFLVHLPYISQIGRNCLTLSSGDVIPVGITYAKKLKEKVNHYYSLFH